jgi:predicted nucleic acid-binding protein
MKSVYADADYWIAVLHPKEQLHGSAVQVSRNLGPARIVTSEMVLVEVLNTLGSRGESVRVKAGESIRQLREAPNVTIVPQTSAQFSDALVFYQGHKDKEWSVTDCASFLIMRERGLTEVLTHDRHFEQIGFIALLRRGQQRDDLQGADGQENEQP